MSREIRIDAFQDLEYVVSDAEYASINWGNSTEDTVVFEATNGEKVYFNWPLVAVVNVAGASAPVGPPTPSYNMRVVTESGEFDAHINETTRDALIVLLAGPGSENMIMEFISLNGDEVKFANRNSLFISFFPDVFVPPTP